MKRSQRGDTTVFTADTINDPDGWTAALTARDDSKLAKRTETIDGQKIEIEAWPDDPQWGQFVDDQLREVAPTMKELIGLPWPEEKSTISVIETAAPYVYGYAGWFDPLLNTIEVGDALDPIVILHELAHTWFNREVFSDRWVNEALADEFAARALERTGHPLEGPEPIAPDAPGAFRLNAWEPPQFQDSDESAELFGYNASWTVMRTISNEIGMDAMARVVAAASKTEIAYRGHNEVETSRMGRDWRHLLDLFQEVGGSKQAEGVFGQYAVELTDADELAARSAARAKYQEFIATSNGVTPPLAVRERMDRWDFTGATALLPRAKTLKDKLDAVVQALQPAGIASPAAVVHRYETASVLDDLDHYLDRALEAARQLTALERSVQGGHNVVDAFGLYVTGADNELSRAVRAFNEGDVELALQRSDHVRDYVDGATRSGLIALFAILFVVVAGVTVMRRGTPLARRWATTARAFDWQPWAPVRRR
jgi:hypothetical protein